ncbi:MAG TPA: hypothetical protein VJ440_05935, partial [Candidatus Brocadiaceae bacterium]|nr:hypothetical protein [Candidatus Brocadiaceae bacterium]
SHYCVVVNETSSPYDIPSSFTVAFNFAAVFLTFVADFVIAFGICGIWRLLAYLRSPLVPS